MKKLLFFCLITSLIMCQNSSPEFQNTKTYSSDSAFFITENGPAQYISDTFKIVIKDSSNSLVVYNMTKKLRYSITVDSMVHSQTMSIIGIEEDVILSAFTSTINEKPNHTFSVMMYLDGQIHSIGFGNGISMIIVKLKILRPKLNQPSKKQPVTVFGTITT